MKRSCRLPSCRLLSFIWDCRLRNLLKMEERKTVCGKMNYRQFMCGSAGWVLESSFLFSGVCVEEEPWWVTTVYIQPSIRMRRTVVEVSHLVLLHTALHVHMQPVELYWVKGLLVQRTGTLDLELQGHNMCVIFLNPYFDHRLNRLVRSGIVKRRSRKFSSLTILNRAPGNFIFSLELEYYWCPQKSPQLHPALS